MANHESAISGLNARKDRFATTHWSMVVSAGGRGKDARSSEAERALAELCEHYWLPLYAFVRRAGHSAEDAQDLTQEFFVGLLSKNVLAVADPQRGRFRSFLLGAMKHFLAKEHRKNTAQKRGGNRPGISLDFASGESWYSRIEPADHLTPERLYEKRWAMALLDLVLNRLCEEFQTAGKHDEFEVLKQYLVGGADASRSKYAEAAERLGTSEGAVKVAVHRMRRRYRSLLKEEIAKTVVDSKSLDEELRELLAALGAG